MAITSTDIPQLVFNKMSSAKYNELKEAGQLVDNEFYITPDITNIPDIDSETNGKFLSNDGSTLLWKNSNSLTSSLSNCITKDNIHIICEWNAEGKLIIKAGSQQMVPYGFNENNEMVFQVLTFNTDYTVPDYGNTTFVGNRCIYASTEYIVSGDIDLFFSGETPPENPTAATTWYDTVHNTIRTYDYINKTWSAESGGTYSFPFIKYTNDGYVKFNKFGYVGNIIFCCPNVELSIPSGVNDDGSLNNLIHLTNKVHLLQVLGKKDTSYFLYGSDDSLVYSDEIKTNSTYYNSTQNKVIKNNEISSLTNYVMCGTFKIDNDIISEFSVNTQANLVDYNHLNTNIDIINDKLNEKLDINQITNCITKIPQDIKLELNEGVLTLKAGSKIYYPNGTSIIIENDIQNQSITGNSTSFIRYQNGLLLADWDISTFSSGTTVPSDYNGWFFNTTEKTICFFNFGIKEENTNCSLPMGIATVTTNTVTSIDQVFNGFGYIGNTIFALPGVKGLVPNGRNTDGSLNHVSFTVPSVVMYTNTIERNNAKLSIGPGGTLTNIILRNTLTYNSDINYNYNGTSNALELNCGLVTSDSTGRITSFNPKNNFQAVDYNDTSYIVQQSMPSNKYIDLTLGASGTTYIAPANGWFYFNKVKGSGNYTAILLGQNTTFENTLRCEVKENNSNINCELPCTLQVKKGEAVTISYNADGATRGFRFIYAQGEL